MSRVPFTLASAATRPHLDEEWETEELRPEPMLELARAARHRRPRVVISGVAALAPNGNTAEEFWANCLAGKSGVAGITHFDPSQLPTRFAGEIRNFDPANYMNFKEARRMSRSSQYSVACAQMAATDAHLQLPAANPERVGVYIGTAVGGYDVAESALKTLFFKGYQRVSPFAIGAAMPNGPAFQVAMCIGSRGYLGTVTAACASGTQAIGEAAEVIRRGWADVMFSGGTEAGIIETAIAGFTQMRALSTLNEAPEKACRPYDKNRDGFVLGEGAAMFVLESLEHAIARNAPIYAEVLGSGVAHDAYDVAAPDPSGEGEVRVMRFALADAGVSPDEVDCISGHGASTPIGDLVETIAIKKLFGPRAYKIPIMATKSLIGHGLGAAGAHETLACVLALRDQKLHPTINYETPDPECDLDYVPNQAREARVETILKNSFGLGGQNASLILRRFDA